MMSVERCTVKFTQLFTPTQKTSADLLAEAKGISTGELMRRLLEDELDRSRSHAQEVPCADA